jgi:hypothetical protein
MYALPPQLNRRLLQVIQTNEDDVFVAVTDWQWEVWPLHRFWPSFPWPFYSSVFHIKDACFQQQFLMNVLPRAFCVPQVWARENMVQAPPYERWLLDEGR